ncbi:MAG TPA: response regulator [Thermoanaerobaculia bacterium]|nr:response regulator [Thermoanaerobaculia bacterium]
MKQMPEQDRHPRLLVVEDEATVQAALKKYFTAAGFEVRCACELEEAEALLVTDLYDVVIADLRLSWSYAAEGLEILRFVRRHSRGTHVIILSAYASADLQHSARALGADAFFQKPAALPEIAATIARLMEKQP